MLIRRQGEDTWGSPETTSFQDEASLQKLIAKSPDLLPGCDGSESVAMEFRIPTAGPADLVCVSSTGVLTLVECKLQSNPEIRRRIVGQVLAYAAGLWKLSYEDFDAAFEARHGCSLAESFDGRADLDEETLRSTVAANLESGSFSLVLAVDAITDELKRIVSYLNTHTTPDVRVLAVEVDYTAGLDVEILVPRTYGEETATSIERRWTEAELITAVEASSTPEVVNAVQRLVDFGLENDARFFYHKASTALPAVEIWIGLKNQLNVSYGLYAGDIGSTMVAVNFDWMRPYADEPTLRRLLDQLRELPSPAAEILRDVDTKDFRQRPKLPVDEVLVTEQAQERFERAFLDAIRSGQPPKSG